jgi:hypothetical protein
VDCTPRGATLATGLSITDADRKLAVSEGISNEAKRKVAEAEGNTNEARKRLAESESVSTDRNKPVVVATANGATTRPVCP